MPSCRAARPMSPRCRRGERAEPLPAALLRAAGRLEAGGATVLPARRCRHALHDAGGGGRVRGGLALRRQGTVCTPLAVGLGRTLAAGAVSAAKEFRRDVFRSSLRGRRDRHQPVAALQRPLHDHRPVRGLRAGHLAQRLYLPSAEDRRARRHRLSRLHGQGQGVRRLQGGQADAARDLRAGRRQGLRHLRGHQQFRPVPRRRGRARQPAELLGRSLLPRRLHVPAVPARHAGTSEGRRASASARPPISSSRCASTITRRLGRARLRESPAPASARRTTKPRRNRQRLRSGCHVAKRTTPVTISSAPAPLPSQSRYAALQRSRKGVTDGNPVLAFLQNNKNRTGGKQCFGSSGHDPSALLEWREPRRASAATPVSSMQSVLGPHAGLLALGSVEGGLGTYPRHRPAHGAVQQDQRLDGGSLGRPRQLDRACSITPTISRRCRPCSPARAC